MQNHNFNHGLRPNDPLWYFLGEFSPGEFMVDEDIGDELSTEKQFQRARDLGIQPEPLKNLKKKLAAFAQEMMAHAIQGRFRIPRRIRLFCLKKTIEDKNSMNGGWGYFLIERGENTQAGPAASSSNCVDLYLYREGE